MRRLVLIDGPVGKVYLKQVTSGSVLPVCEGAVLVQLGLVSGLDGGIAGESGRGRAGILGGEGEGGGEEERGDGEEDGGGELHFGWWS